MDKGIQDGSIKMTLDELKKEIGRYQYLEDDRFIDACLAAVIATRLKIGDPLWLVLVGPSSSGKTQVLRPLAMTDSGFMHSIDDLTENTFLSAMKTKTGEMSLLSRIGAQGMLVISDLTGIFSKQAEARGAILGQLRMIYDGEMTKHAGTSTTPISWKGHLGLIAGSTPALYRKFAETASMGERFMYYRLKDYDKKKAGMRAMKREGGGDKTNLMLRDLYTAYLKEIIGSTVAVPVISEKNQERIVDAAIFAENIRVSAEFDWKGEEMISIPVPAMPMRTALQLSTMMKAFILMNGAEREEDMQTIEWCAWSLANDERRKCLNILSGIPEGSYMNTSTIGDRAALPTGTARTILQTLNAVGVVERTADTNGLMWRISSQGYRDFVKRVEGLKEEKAIDMRGITTEERHDHDQSLNYQLEHGFISSQKDE